MKFYIASKFEQKELVIEATKKLVAAGHSASYDWTDHIQHKPYSQFQQVAKRYSEEEVQGILVCDVLILITAPEKGAGYSTELGVALGSNVLRKKPAIYVVGKYTDLNLFYFHPAITRVDAIEDVLQDIAI